MIGALRSHGRSLAGGGLNPRRRPLLFYAVLAVRGFPRGVFFIVASIRIAASLLSQQDGLRHGAEVRPRRCKRIVLPRRL